MVSLLALVALASVPAALAQQLTINTPPSVVQCQPSQLTWTGGTPPYFLSLIPAGQASAPPLEALPNQQGNSFTWKADLAAGTSFTISLKDNTGAQAFSDIVNVQSSGDSSCVGKGQSSGAGAPTSAGASSGAAPSGTAPAATTGASSAASGPAASAPGPSGASPASSASASASGGARPSSASGSSAPSASPSNSASNVKGNALAMAGVMGLVGAVLF